ncbi:uncharacterized protein LOC123214057 [Mangifera indica]|uniref:uncharacterized protein LOC123214057 n=1 Tax=Mangifera indica TaxID=29780 RepID=UPI001CFB1763|nr:uncharacterized protein LOC123214057 [Mangifera indica]
MSGALPSLFLSIETSQPHLVSGASLNPPRKCCLNTTPSDLCGKVLISKHKRTLTVRAVGDDRRQNIASIFVGGFILGGIVVGTLGCIYAPQISEALAGADRKKFMRRLPKFIYDEEKALEKTRKVLTLKIEQLNSAIDDLSAQLHANDTPNGSAVNSDEVEASL